MILIVTSSTDEHADVVCPKIQAAGGTVFRFDTDQLERYQIGFDPISHVLSLFDRTSRIEVSNEDVTSVWYRRPSPDKTLDGVLDDDSVRLVRAESKAWIKSITFALKQAFWVTAPWVLYEARVKTNQLSAANRVGLRVPRTLVTRDAELVRQFHADSKTGIVAKTLKLPYLESTDAHFAFRTQEVHSSDLDDASLYVCPTIFQDKILASYELRVVAIGRQLFAFKATRKTAGALDIRTSGQSNVEFSPIELSHSVSTKIRALLDLFGLPFSSMDLLVDFDGNEHFVDLNPNGQWFWLEHVTGIPLSDVFVGMMLSCRMPE